MITVVKIGGVLLTEPARAAEEICRMAGKSPTVVIHGGGIQITRMLETMGVPSKFVDGLRVTDEATLHTVALALMGEVHGTLVHAMRRSGTPAVGLFGVVHACRRQGPWGFVGDGVRAEQTVIRSVLNAGHVPVIPTLAVGADSLLNVNADETAAAVAVTLGATRLLFMTDVAGVQDQNGSVIHHAPMAEELLRSGFVSGGMLPKLRAVQAAMNGGIRDVRVGRTVFGGEG